MCRLRLGEGEEDSNGAEAEAGLTSLTECEAAASPDLLSSDSGFRTDEARSNTEEGGAGELTDTAPELGEEDGEGELMEDSEEEVSFCRYYSAAIAPILDVGETVFLMKLIFQRSRGRSAEKLRAVRHFVLIERGGDHRLPRPGQQGLHTRQQGPTVATVEGQLIQSPSVPPLVLTLLQPLPEGMSSAMVELERYFQQPRRWDIWDIGIPVAFSHTVYKIHAGARCTIFIS